MLRCLGAVLAFFCLCDSASAQGRLLLSQYAHSAWRVQDGYFSGAPQVITQTTDGYIWVGTSTGLVRFDGVRFESRIPGDTIPSSLSAFIAALHGSRDGSLWIGTRTGLFRLKDGILSAVDTRPGTVDQLAEDSDGTIWFVRTGPDDKFCRSTAQLEVRCLTAADGVTNPNASQLLVGPDNSIWLGGGGLVHWNRRSSRKFLERELAATDGLSGVQAIAHGPDGSVWVGMVRGGPGLGLQRVRDGVIEPVALNGMDASRLAVYALLRDRSQTMWVGVRGDGIYRVDRGSVDRFSTVDGLSGNTVHDLYEDREGNIWAVTPEGVDCFRQLPMVTYSAREGAGYQAGSVLAARDGTVWLGHRASLGSIRDGVVSALLSGQGLPGSAVTSMLEARDGRLWIGVDQELFVRDGPRFERVQRADGGGVGIVMDIVQDRDGAVWVLTPRLRDTPKKLQRIEGLRVVQEILEPQMPPNVNALAADPDGGLWIGVDGGLARFRNGAFQTLAPLLPKGSLVAQLLSAPDGAVLGSTPNGVVAWRGNTLRTLTTKNGLPCDLVHALLFDQQNALWLYTRCGLLRIGAADVEKWWLAGDAIVTPTEFGVVDGVRPARATFTPNASRSPDGRLWFANDNDVQVIDPARLFENPKSAPVHIERVIADRREYPARGPVYLPPLNRDLEVSFTGLSFVAPQKVAFRYQLQGRDEDWQDAGTRRQAFYNDLPPGSYRFRVAAKDSAGAWSDEGAAIEIIIAPAWYQTGWFMSLSVLVAAIAVWGVHRLRIRQVSRGLNARFDERLAERTRLARELHDTLLQTVQGSKLVADHALSRPEGSVNLRAAIEQLSQWLGQASTEGRAAVHALRDPAGDTDDLPTAFERAIEDCRGQRPIAGSLSVNGAPRDTRPLVRDELYRIGYEAIRNACLHSNGSRVHVDLTYGQDLVLRVTDDGVGIDVEVASQGKAGHFGVAGMRERAAKLGATLALGRLPGGGTELLVSLPGRIAFKESGPLAGRLTKWLFP